MSAPCPPPRRRAASALLFFAAVPCGPAARADVVVLRTGGEVRGEFVGDPRADGPLTVRTLAGADVTVDRTDVRSWAYRTPKREEFERRYDRAGAGLDGAPLPDDEAADAWWDLADWALARRMPAERDRALERVILHAPRHEPARKALGHVKDDGEWVTRAQWRARRGLVLHDGRAVSPEERALLEKADESDAARRAWYRDVRRWRRDLRDPRQAGAARAALANVRDPAAAEALRKFFADDADPGVRTLLVRTLARLPGEAPVPALADQAMRDVDKDVRREAVAALAPAGRRDAAARLLRGGLRSKDNLTVRRAASALTEVGDARAVPDLIKSLVTTHYYKVPVPDASGASMTRGPGGTSFGNGLGGAAAALPPEVAGALLTGQLPAGVSFVPDRRARPQRMTTVKVDHTNPEVLLALRRLTAADAPAAPGVTPAASPPPTGYDEAEWAAWWEANGGAN